MYTLDKPDNLVEIFENSVVRFANHNLFGTKDDTGNYTWISYEDVGKRVDNFRSGMSNLGIKNGDTVAIISNNCVEWAVSCYATYGLCARFVPMYEAELSKIWKYIIEDSRAKLLIVSNDSIYDEVKNWTDEIENLENIIAIKSSNSKSFKEIEKIGQELPVKSIIPSPDDIAGLIYTSGTTGAPKGVLISHGNFSSNVHAIKKAFPYMTDTDVTLSFLPWAHSFGQIAELHSLVINGCATGFAEKPETIIDDIQIVRPTILVAVPRIFNKVYDKLLIKINEEGGIKKKLFLMATESAKQKRVLHNEGKSDFIVNLKYSFGNSLVFSKIRDRFGGRLRFCISASAALSRNIIEFFFDIGLPIYEGYGMTELSPCVSVNSPDAVRIGSVGKPIDKTTIKVDYSVVEKDAADGELIVYGPNVMQGYFNKPDATKEVITEDGGIRTGDRGYLDEDGYLFITGRIKEQYKLENGKYVFPAAIEEEIKLVPFVEQAIVVGDGKPYNICLIFPDMEVLSKYAKEHNLTQSLNELVNDKFVKSTVESEVIKQLKGKFGKYEIPQKVMLLSEGFTIENNMLTPTMKLKRRNVLSQYQQMIDGLYKD